MTRSILFNATVFMDSRSGQACEITRNKVGRYLRSKEGTLVNVEDIHMHYFSLHEVEILDFSERFNVFSLKASPLITMDTIKEIRSLFRCDCTMFWSTGRTCSHLLAALSLLGKFDMEIAKQNIPTTKLSGGQRTIPGALYVDASDSWSFSVPHLERKLIQQPHYPHGRQVTKAFAVSVNGVTEELTVIGKIKGYSGTGGRYRWLVAFTNNTEECFGCEDLVRLIVAARRDGLDVTCSAVGGSGAEAVVEQ